MERHRYTNHKKTKKLWRLRDQRGELVLLRLHLYQLSFIVLDRFGSGLIRVTGSHSQKRELLELKLELVMASYCANDIASSSATEAAPNPSHETCIGLPGA